MYSNWRKLKILDLIILYTLSMILIVRLFLNSFGYRFQKELGNCMDMVKHFMKKPFKHTISYRDWMKLGRIQNKVFKKLLKDYSRWYRNIGKEIILMRMRMIYRLRKLMKMRICLEGILEALMMGLVEIMAVAMVMVVAMVEELEYPKVGWQLLRYLVFLVLSR